MVTERDMVDMTDVLTVPEWIARERRVIPVAQIDDAAGWVTSKDIVDGFRESIRDGVPIAPPTVADMSVFDGWNAGQTVYDPMDGINRVRAYRAEAVAEIEADVYIFANPQDVLVNRLRACLHKPDEVLYMRALRGLAQLVTARLTGRMRDIHLYEPEIGENGVWRAVPRQSPTPQDAAQLVWAFDDHLFALQQIGQEPDTTWERELNATIQEVCQAIGKTPAWLREEALARFLLLPDGEARGKRASVRPALARVRDRELRQRVTERWQREKVGVSALNDALAYLGLLKRGPMDAWVPRRERSWIASKLNQLSLAQLAFLYVQDERLYLQRLVAKSAPTRPAAPQETPKPTPPSQSDAIFSQGSPQFIQTPSAMPTMALPRITPPPVSPAISSRSEQSPAPRANDQPVYEVTRLLLDCVADYEWQGGDWSTPAAQESIRQLAALVKRVQALGG